MLYLGKESDNVTSYKTKLNWLFVLHICNEEELKLLKKNQKSHTLLYDPYSVLRHPLTRLVSSGLCASCHLFGVVQLSSKDQIPVILQNKMIQDVS